MPRRSPDDTLPTTAELDTAELEASTAPPNVDLDAALARALELAREVAPLLRQGRRRGAAQVDEKRAADLVTEHDREASEHLVHGLEQSFPDHRVVSEEGDLHATPQHDAEHAPLEPTWYVDPLDGTTNFVHRLPWYGISLGLQLADRPLVGVVIAPEMRWEFTAKRGAGAFLNGEPIAVSTTTTLREALLATGLSDRFEHRRLDNLRAVLASSHGIRRIGAACLDCAMVAAGWVDGYWDRGLKPWDLCAGVLLVEEAGGQVTGSDGWRFDLAGGHLVASNGRIHSELLGLLDVVQRRVDERRANPRFDRQVALKMMHRGMTLELNTVNVSRGGALLALDAPSAPPLKLGSRVELLTAARGGPRRSPATVVRLERPDRGVRFAVRFERPGSGPLARLPSVH